MSIVVRDRSDESCLVKQCDPSAGVHQDSHPRNSRFIKKISVWRSRTQKLDPISTLGLYADHVRCCRCRVKQISEAWFAAVCEAWWDAWIGTFSDLGTHIWRAWVPKSVDEYLHKHQLGADLRALERDQLDADLIVSGGGLFEGSGTGGND